jgi:hypothetical protein
MPSVNPHRESRVPCLQRLAVTHAASRTHACVYPHPTAFLVTELSRECASHNCPQKAQRRPVFFAVGHLDGRLWAKLDYFLQSTKQNMCFSIERSHTSLARIARRLI